jgi:hypothetical protein
VPTNGQCVRVMAHWLGSGWNNLIEGNFLDLTIGQIAFTLIIIFILWANLLEGWRNLMEVWRKRK